MAYFGDLSSGISGELAGTECSPGTADLLNDSLWVESSVAAAQTLYTTGFVEAPCAAAQGGCSTSPISGVGDEASLYFIPCEAGGSGCNNGGFINGGVVRVANDVFDIQSQDNNSYDYRTLLAEAVAQLCPGCAFAPSTDVGGRRGRSWALP